MRQLGISLQAFSLKYLYIQGKILWLVYQASKAFKPSVVWSTRSIIIVTMTTAAAAGVTMVACGLLYSAAERACNLLHVWLFSKCHLCTSGAFQGCVYYFWFPSLFGLHLPSFLPHLSFFSLCSFPSPTSQHPLCFISKGDGKRAREHERQGREGR